MGVNKLMMARTIIYHQVEEEKATEIVLDKRGNSGLQMQDCISRGCENILGENNPSGVVNDCDACEEMCSGNYQ